MGRRSLRRRCCLARKEVAAMRQERKMQMLNRASSRLLHADRREALLLDELEEDLEFAEDWAGGSPAPKKEKKAPRGHDAG
jgi:hypothetical protein